MAKGTKTFFSKSDLYHFADRIVEMYIKYELILRFAKMENNQVEIDAYSGLVYDLNLLIEAYNLREMVKIS